MNKLFTPEPHPFDCHFGTLSSVISGRFTIENALDVVHPIVKTVGNTVVSDAVDKWRAEFGHSRFGRSNMKQTFHSSPKFSFADVKSTQETLAWINRKLKTKFAITSNVDSSYKALELLEVSNALMHAVGATDISGYIKTTGKPKVTTGPPGRRSLKIRQILARLEKSRLVQLKRATCRAKLVLSNGSITKTRTSLPAWKKLYFGDYKRALKFVSKFMGRIHTWFNAWARAEFAVVAKVGLVKIALAKYDYDLKNYPLTMIFLSLASSEFAKRKEFTLESQHQGGLNVHLMTMLDEIIKKERGGVKYISFMIPAKELWMHVDGAFLSSIAQEWKTWMQLFSIVLEEQWTKGVAKSSRRSMRVLPGAHYQRATGKSVKKSGVNSNLWNVAADSWNLGAKFQRGLDIFLHKPLTFWGKTLQLIANDQFMWGQHAGKGVGSDTDLFRELTKEVLPWHVVHPWYYSTYDSQFAMQVFLTSAEKLGVKNAGTWLATPILHTANVTVHRDLICGCPVPSMSQEVYDYLATEFKPFGATGWATIKDKDV